MDSTVECSTLSRDPTRTVENKCHAVEEDVLRMSTWPVMGEDITGRYLDQSKCRCEETTSHDVLSVIMDIIFFHRS